MNLFTRLFNKPPTARQRYRHEYPTPEWAKRIYSNAPELTEREKERVRFWQHRLDNDLRYEVTGLVYVPELNTAPVPAWGYEVLISSRKLPHICETICCTHVPQVKIQAMRTYVLELVRALRVGAGGHRLPRVSD